MNNAKRVQRIFDDFCDSTSIHGLLQIKSVPYPLKIAWILILLFMLICTTWFTAKSINLYLAHDIKTKLVYETAKEINFPAITFCNQFSLKAEAGVNIYVLLMYETLLAKRAEDIPKMVSESQEVCKTEKKSVYENLTLDMNMVDFVDKVKLFTQDSFKSVEKCWWRNREINCLGMFANEVLDSGVCFTFIPNRGAARNLVHSGISSSYYGVNDTDFEDKILINTGSKNGLQLLLNARQKEHCDVSKKYEGAGFRFFVHDAENLRPLSTFYPSYLLKPGSATNVLLTPTIIYRDTADLGKCNKPLYWFNDKKIYYRNFCVQLCSLRIIYQKCLCIAKFLFTGSEIYLSSILGKNISNWKNCDVNEFKCAKQGFLEAVDAEDLQKSCSECLQPCFETTYDVLISYQKFPTKRFIKYFENQFNITNVSDIRKSYMNVNFFFDSLTILNVFEMEAFSKVDMFIYIGNVVSLFFGMSFQSLFEIWYVFIVILVYVFKKSTDYMRHVNKQKLIRRRRIQGQRTITRQSDISRKVATKVAWQK